MDPNSKHLAEIQAWMQQALMFPGQTDSQEGTVMHIAPSQSLSAAQRLAIYQRGYFARLLQCLEGQYKALCHALGKELFDDFAKEYLRQSPSTNPTLALLGARFPDFLRETRPDQEASEKEPWVEFMIALAQFEWDLYSMFDAPGHEGKAYAGALDLEENLRLQPCFSIHKYDFPVSIYYNAVARGRDPDVPVPREHFVSIVRKDFRTAIFDLLPPQYTFLQEMMAGKIVKEALASTALAYHKSEKEAQEAWAEWKKAWLEAGFFINI
ncbi:MAG: DNA-binding domain-containing protein [Saprospiraceae bacterium]|nr:DNA-binding domain-containing protein [Saprospiraceae bacterium]